MTYAEKWAGIFKLCFEPAILSNPTYTPEASQEVVVNLHDTVLDFLETAMQAQREACLIAVQRPLISGSKADIETAIINAEVQP